MVLKELIDKLMDTGGLIIVVDGHENTAESYTDKKHFDEYQNCEVETISLAEYETMIVTLSGSSKGD